MNIDIKNKTEIPNRSIDLIINDDNKKIVIQFDYLRCANICLPFDTQNEIDEFINRFKEIHKNDVNLLIVNSYETIDSYYNVIELKSDIPSLVLIDLTKVPPLYITHLLIESLIKGLNVILLMDSKFIKGGYYTIPFGEEFNNTDYVQGAVNLNNIKGDVILNTSSFIY